MMVIIHTYMMSARNIGYVTLIEQNLIYLTLEVLALTSST